MALGDGIRDDLIHHVKGVVPAVPLGWASVVDLEWKKGGHRKKRGVVEIRRWADTTRRIVQQSSCYRTTLMVELASSICSVVLCRQLHSGKEVVLSCGGICQRGEHFLSNLKNLEISGKDG